MMQTVNSPIFSGIIAVETSYWTFTMILSKLRWWWIDKKESDLTISIQWINGTKYINKSAPFVKEDYKLIHLLSIDYLHVFAFSSMFYCNKIWTNFLNSCKGNVTISWRVGYTKSSSSHSTFIIPIGQTI